MYINKIKIRSLMRCSLHNILLLFLLFFTPLLQAESTSRIDSLKQVINTNLNDSNRLNSFNELSKLYININKDTAFYYSDKALLLAKSSKNNKGIVTSYKTIGLIYFNNGDYKLAIQNFNKSIKNAEDKNEDILDVIYYQKGVTYFYTDNYTEALNNFNLALTFAKKYDNNKIIFRCYNAIGVLKKVQGEYEKAISYYLKALKIAEQEDDKDGISDLYNNIGLIYKAQDLNDKALEYYNKALQISLKIKNDNNLMKLNGNIGVVYKNKGNNNKAIEYYNRALKIAKRINSKKGISSAFTNIGNIHLIIGNYEKAIKFFNKVIEIKLELEDKEGLSTVYQSLGSLYSVLADSSRSNKTKSQMYLNKSASYSKKAFIIADTINLPVVKRDAAITLTKVLKKLNKIDKALHYSLIYININDSIFNKEKFTIVQELENKYNTEKNKLQIEKLKKEQELKDEKIKQQEYKDLIYTREKYLLLFGLIALFIVILIIYRNLVKNKKLNIELTNQKQIIEESKTKIEEVVQQFEDTIENLEDVYFKTDRNFNYLQVSPSILKHLNLTNTNQIIGKPLTEHWNISKNDLKSIISKLIKEQVVKNLLINYKSDSKDLKFARINARAIFKDNRFIGAEGIIRDVTKDVIANRKIIELNTQKEVLINNIPSAIFYKDNNLKYIEVNNHFANLLGYKPDEIIGKTDKELVSEKIRTEYEILNRKVIETKEPIYDYLKLHTDNYGNKSWISTSVIPIINYEDNVEGIIAVIKNVTKQIENENLLKESKENIEKAHKNITDNINYAKTIQQALLTTKDVIDKYLSDYFIMFLPKDQVSGDFYYINKIENKLIFAAADCTGHGVSGGFLTMLSITDLHNIIVQKKITNPSKVLNSLRKVVKNTFKTFGSENNNGLDIALCVLDTNTNILQYSGAFNPLWIIRNNNLIEIKATRNPIGYYIDEVDFKSTKIQLEKNDVIYVFSDGYTDQIGGEKNKKFKTKRFKELLIKISTLPLSQQEKELSQVFKQWKGNKEQTDDIVVMGIKIT